MITQPLRFLLQYAAQSMKELSNAPDEEVQKFVDENPVALKYALDSSMVLIRKNMENWELSTTNNRAQHTALERDIVLEYEYTINGLERPVPEEPSGLVVNGEPVNVQNVNDPGNEALKAEAEARTAEVAEGNVN